MKIKTLLEQFLRECVQVINPDNRHQNILRILFRIRMHTIDVALSADMNDRDKLRASNKHRPLISTAFLGIHIEKIVSL